MSPEHAGIVLVTQPAIMTLFSPLAGILSDKVEPRIIASAGMVITAAGLFMLSFIRPDTHIFFIIACLALLGFGFALFSSPNTNAVMSSVGKDDYGVASGFLATMRVTGQTFSMGAVLVLFSILMGKVRITEEVSSGFMKALQIGFVFFAIACIPGIFASLARGNVRNE
jgi:MFS family permease